MTHPPAIVFDRSVPGFRSPGAWLLLLLLLAPASILAQDRATLLVDVRAEDTRRPIVGAQVSVQGLGLRGTTGADGTVRIEGIPAGSRVVEVRFLGYADARVTVAVRAGALERVPFELVLSPIELAEVRAAVRPTVLQRTGFSQRRVEGNGIYLTREDIERRRADRMGDVLRMVPGLNIRTGSGGLSARATSRGQSSITHSCPIQFFLDGTLTSIINVEDIPTGVVEGIEIYRGSSTIPAQYNVGRAACGVVLVWTREGQSTRRD